jgi:beta-phosphoglucomutase
VRSLEILLEIGNLKMGEAVKQSMAAQKNGWYVEYIQNMDASEILPGTREYLHTLHAHGVKTAIGSASKNAPLILERLGIRSLFDVVVDGSKVSQAKPDPEVFLRAANELEVAPANCIVFEDAEAGIEAAHRAGMGAVGIGKPITLREADMVMGGLYQLVVLTAAKGGV